MENDSLDCYVMLINNNPGESTEELIPIIQNIGPFDHIHVLRQYVNDRIIHLSIGIVKFKSSETAEKAIHIASSMPELTIMKLDPFYLSPVMSLIVGLKHVDNVEYYSKLLLPLGVQSVRALDTTLESDPFILVASFIDKAQRKLFKKRMNGVTSNGKKVQVIPLRRITTSGFTSKTSPFLHNVLSISTKHDFTLYHFDKEYHCWSGSVYALSSVIQDNIRHDPSLKEFVVPNIPGPFILIESYLQGNIIDINACNAAFLLTMAKKLGIRHLFNNVNMFIKTATDLNTRISLLKGFHELNFIPDHIIDYIAQYFEKAKEIEEFNYLSTDLLLKIISSPRLQVLNESSLFKWMLSLAETAPQKFKHLIKQISLDKLDSQSLKEFFNLPPDFINLNDFRLSLSRIGKHVKYPNYSGLQNKETEFDIDKYQHFHRLFISASFPYKEGELFNGICHYLNLEKPLTPKGDLSITVTASSVFHGEPRILVSENKNNNWFGTTEANPSFVIIIFNWETVSLTGYSIQTHNQPGKGHMNYWTLSGSNNAETWTVLDKVANNSSLNGAGKAHYFPLKEQSQPFKMFKLSQDRANPLGYFSLNLARIEFFGTLQ